MTMSSKKDKQYNMFDDNQLPHFTSTPDEIKLAVEKNAVDRGRLFIKLIASFKIDSLLNKIDALSENIPREEFINWADDIGIKHSALDRLDDNQIPYPYYFCRPDTLINEPELIFYYRNVAMLSNKVMNDIGLNTERFEEGRDAPSEEKADDLATYFNEIISDLVLENVLSKYRHIVMMISNLGDALGGSSRNEVGRIAMVRIINPIIRHLHDMGLLTKIEYRLKGKISSKGSSGETSRQWIDISSQTDIEKLLATFKENRVWYYTLVTENGSVLKLNRQLAWSDNMGNQYKMGPDAYSEVGEVDMFWAAELKGGADPAGSDEHWKTATQALDRILKAAEETGRPKPKLSFIATIIVERVAEEAREWIDQGKLSSVYNLTQMYHTREEEMSRFLEDVAAFMGY